jgi:hypothetical protein
MSSDLCCGQEFLGKGQVHSYFLSPGCRVATSAIVEAIHARSPRRYDDREVTLYGEWVH